MAMLGVNDGLIEIKEQGIMTKNPVAKELRTPKYKSKVVKDKKKYDRKKYNAAIAYHEMLKYFRNNNVD
jgi:hypothetical protein